MGWFLVINSAWYSVSPFEMTKLLPDAGLSALCDNTRGDSYHPSQFTDDEIEVQGFIEDQQQS